MRAADVMTRDPETCYPLDSQNRAAQIMWERDCGSVPVVDGEGRLVGMITDRDLCMAAYTGGGRLCETNVSRAMSTAVHACGPDDPLDEVLRTMRVHQVRRVPVTAADGRLVGLISLSDLARKLPAASAETCSALLRTLAEVSAPRGVPAGQVESATETQPTPRGRGAPQSPPRTRTVKPARRR